MTDDILGQGVFVFTPGGQIIRLPKVRTRSIAPPWAAARPALHFCCVLRQWGNTHQQALHPPMTHGLTWGLQTAASAHALLHISRLGCTHELLELAAHLPDLTLLRALRRHAARAGRHGGGLCVPHPHPGRQHDGGRQGEQQGGAGGLRAAECG